MPDDRPRHRYTNRRFIGRTIFLTVAADWYFQDVPSLDTTNNLALLTLGLTWF